MICDGQNCFCPSKTSLRDECVDEKDGADAEPAGEAASRGRIILRATASKRYVTESHSLRIENQLLTMNVKSFNKKTPLFTVSLIFLVVIISLVLKTYYISNNKSVINDVTYYCSEGVLNAEFGKNYVVINFPNSENILLPQTISGSGIRYEMGSTTFMGKGDNASLTEDGVATYTNCLTGNQITKNETSTFTDRSKTFSFSYPDQYVLSGSDFGYSQDWSVGSNDLGLLLAKVEMPRTIFTEKTNFAGAKFTIGASSNPDAINNCFIYNYGPNGTTTSVVINGIKYVKLDFSDAGAGNYYETTSYRTVHNDQCYSIEYTIHSMNINNYPPEQGVRPFDKEKVTSILDDIVKSFKFI